MVCRVKCNKPGHKDCFIEFQVRDAIDPKEKTLPGEIFVVTGFVCGKNEGHRFLVGDILHAIRGIAPDTV
jgi:hypothetical protein